MRALARVLSSGGLRRLSVKPMTVQRKMLGPRNNATRKYSLKLRPGFKPLHTKPLVA